MSRTAEHDDAMRSIQQEAAGAPISVIAARVVRYAAGLDGIDRATLTLHSGVVRSATSPRLSSRIDPHRALDTVAFAVTAPQGHLGVLTVETGMTALPTRTLHCLTDLGDVTGRIVLAITHRQSVDDLLDEHSSLRRIAESAARGVPLPELFESVVDDTARLFGSARSTLLHHQSVGAAAQVVATAVQPQVEPGSDDGDRSDSLPAPDRRVELVRVRVPVTVEGEAWGLLSVDWTASAPGDAVDRLKPFADLTAIAIANANNREGLTRSRARIIAAGDDARRRLQRDVHDGAQQRLVHTILSLKLARDRSRTGEPVADLIDEALANAEEANRQLRDVVRGILPAALTRAGLVAGIESFVADVALPVQLHLAIPRLPAALETTGYFTVAEAITNAIKHAGASRLAVAATISEVTDELVIVVTDDGVGGADPGRGSGLTGLMDRVEAGYGTLTIVSPAGQGTTITARLRLQPHLQTDGTTP